MTDDINPTDWATLPAGSKAGRFMKRPRLVNVRFAERDQRISTLEGMVACRQGDAIVTGIVGESWPVPIEVFARKYEAVPPTAEGTAGVYKTLPQAVFALQIDAATEVRLSNGRGTLTGNAGDWLVEYAPGDCSIVKEGIFYDTYDALTA